VTLKLPWPVSSGPGFTAKVIASFTKTFTRKKSAVNFAVNSAKYGQLRDGVNLGVKFI
jgi:hypothetical protein